MTNARPARQPQRSSPAAPAPQPPYAEAQDLDLSSDRLGAGAKLSPVPQSHPSTSQNYELPSTAPGRAQSVKQDAAKSLDPLHAPQEAPDLAHRSAPDLAPPLASHPPPEMGPASSIGADDTVSAAAGQALDPLRERRPSQTPKKAAPVPKQSPLISDPPLSDRLLSDTLPNQASEQASNLIGQGSAQAADGPWGAQARELWGEPGDDFGRLAEQNWQSIPAPHHPSSAPKIADQGPRPVLGHEAGAGDETLQIPSPPLWDLSWHPADQASGPARPHLPEGRDDQSGQTAPDRRQGPPLAQSDNQDSAPPSQQAQIENPQAPSLSQPPDEPVAPPSPTPAPNPMPLERNTQLPAQDVEPLWDPALRLKALPAHSRLDVSQAQREPLAAPRPSGEAPEFWRAPDRTLPPQPPLGAPNLPSSPLIPPDPMSPDHSPADLAPPALRPQSNLPPTQAPSVEPSVPPKWDHRTAQRVDHSLGPNPALPVSRMLPPEPPMDFDLSDLLQSLWSGKWLILTCLLTALCIGAVWNLRQPPLYRAESLLQLERRGGGLALPAGMQDLIDTTGSTALGATEIAILRARSVLSRAVQETGLDLIALPRPLPLLANLPARLGLPDPQLSSLKPFAWGNEAIQIGALDLPNALLGQWLTLTRTSAQTYQLTLPSGETLTGTIGTRLHHPNPEISLLVTQIDGPIGRQFLMQRQPLDQAIQRARLALSASETPRNSALLKIAFTEESPQQAARILDAIIRAYIDQNIQRSAVEAQSSLDFIEQQLPLAEAEMARAQDALNRYRQEQNSVDVQYETQTLLEQTTRLEAELNALALQEDELKKRYTENHPTYQSLIKTKNALKQRLENMRGAPPKLFIDLSQST